MLIEEMYRGFRLQYLLTAAQSVREASITPISDEARIALAELKGVSRESWGQLTIELPRAAFLTRAHIAIDEVLGGVYL
jgi:hypothetical protein